MDAKGRLSMPTEYRSALSTLTVTKSPIPDEPCLVVYPPDEWKKIVEHITAQPNTKSIRTLKRKFISESETLTLDSNGRFLIKPEFREFSSLDKKVKLSAQGNKLELWDEEIYEKVNSAYDEDYIATVEAMPF